MISRAIGARRVCLSCRLGMSQWAALRPRILPLHHDLGRRLYSADGPSTDEILDALMNGRKSMGQVGKKNEKPAPWEDLEPIDEPSDGRSSHKKQHPKDPKAYMYKGAPTVYERSTALPSDPAPFDPEPDAVEQQEEPAERVITPQFSDEDFAYWAADEEGTSESLKKFQESHQPFIVGKTRLERQRLGVGALGQRLNAFVMRDPDSLGTTGSLLPREDELPPPILSAFDGFENTTHEKVPGTDEEAFSNLDALRPTDSSTLTRYDYEALMNEIMLGFNGSQLLGYWRLHRHPDEKPVDARAAYPWLRELGVWTPMDQDAIQAASRSSDGKKYMAYRIMTQIWALQVQEEVEIPGRVTARLAATQHTIITRPSIGILDRIQADLLDEAAGEKIIAHASKRTLEIIARKPVVPVVLARIDVMLESLEKVRISTDGVAEDLLRREIMDELEKVTKTIILLDQAPAKSHIDVCWPRAATMSGAPIDSNRETPADTVRRLLLGRQVSQGTLEDQIIARRFRGGGVAARVGSLTPYHRESRSLSWKDRLLPWSRFIIETLVPAELKKKRSMKLADKVSFPHMQEQAEASTDQLTATFGHIIHTPYKVPGSGKRPKTAYRRMVSPIMPHPAAFSEMVPERGTEISKQTTLVVHFIPKPGSPLSGATAPALKLTMPYSGEEDFSNFTLPSDSTLKAPKQFFTKDILFPEEAVDTRIERHCDLDLDISQQTAFKEFIAASEFNLVEGRLHTPGNTRFSIPRSWLTQEGKEDRANEETVEMPYLFGGLEVRETVDLPWKNGIILRYSSIEAGQHGGTHQELSLVLDLANQSLLGIQTSVTDFLEKLGTAVEGKAWSWTRGASKVHELPHHNDPIWEQFKPKPRKNQSQMSQLADELEEEIEGDEEPGGIVDEYYEEEFDEAEEVDGAVPRSEPLTWSSGPLAPRTQHQEMAAILDSQLDGAAETPTRISDLFPTLAAEESYISPTETSDETANAVNGISDETQPVANANPVATNPDELEDATLGQEPEVTEEAKPISATEPHQEPGSEVNTTERDSQPTGPSNTKASSGPFTPTSSNQNDLRPQHPTPPPEEEDSEVDPALAAEAEAYENMDAEALAAKLDAEAGGVSLEELYRQAGATPAQIAALHEESKKFEEKWKTMAEQGLGEDEPEPTKEEIEAEDKLLAQYLAEDIAREKAEREADEMMEEGEDGDDLEAVLAEEKRKRKKSRKSRGKGM